MSRHCFWILNNGTIVKPDSRHILAVVAAPRAFGETEEPVQETFARHGQQPHPKVKGMARQEILLRTIRRNHIRIRKNRQGWCRYWSLQLFELTREGKQGIAAWAKFISEHTEDRYADVVIYQFVNECKLRTSLDLLAAEYTADQEPEIFFQHQLS